MSPKSCLNCIFYSSLRKRCLKLGIIVENPLTPPCLKKEEEKKTEIEIKTTEKPHVELEKEEELISSDLIDTLKRLEEATKTRDIFIKNLRSLEDFKEKIPPDLYQKLKDDYNSKLIEIDMKIEELKTAAVRLGGVKCPYCKSIILPGSKYCPKCGKKLI